MGNSNGSFDFGEHLKTIPMGLGQHLNFNSNEGDVETAKQSNDARNSPKTSFKLSDAVFRGETGQVKAILENSANSTFVEEQDHDYNTPVHWACLKSRTEILDMLLKKPMPCDVKNRMGDTPLHFACAAGFAEGVRLLLCQKADAWATNTSRATPLHCAVASGRADIVAQLRADDRERFSDRVNAQTRQGDTALHWAAAKGNEDLVLALIEAKAGLNLQNKDARITPLYAACGGEGMDGAGAGGAGVRVVRMLLQARADANVLSSKMESPLFWAVASGRRSVLAALLEHGADPNAQNSDQEAPVHLAVQKGDAAMIEMLYEAGADLNRLTARKDTSLHLAVTRGDSRTVNRLLSFMRHGQRVVRVDTENEQGDSPLHTAAIIGDIETIQSLCNAKALVNAKNHDDETPLHWAAAAGMASVVTYLYTRKGDLHAKNKSGRTPLDLAPDAETRLACTHI